MIIRKLRKVGDSLVISLPCEVIEALKIDNNENIQFVIEDDKVILQKENNKDKDFSKLLDETFFKYDEALRKLSEF
ncbi:antitoxin MazE [Staphylococcus hominis]|uniref:AbrB/MazE/SpoVT family DNA-binding domain-containing protein n=1 Tax=Staphylococcus hominis TaxID=1290 RepID=UPI0010D54C09|nr:addiction module antitoxin [Staphylococcus hominis]MCI2852748.1 addiction module antitoxin [Staphylococcus hominis]TBW92780.1 addiction module antitoxin [Staphylococcus hominis]UNQ68977.1 addiction module antitoxin [Staphylococcus hominis]